MIEYEHKKQKASSKTKFLLFLVFFTVILGGFITTVVLTELQYQRQEEPKTAE